MPLPTFSLAGVPTLTFSRSDLFPTVRQMRPRQRVAFSEAGTAHVATFSLPETLHVLAFEGLTAADHAALLAFLGHALVNWSGAAFTYTDVAGVTFLVRYLSGIDTAQETSAGSWSVTLTLREEIA